MSAGEFFLNGFTVLGGMWGVYAVALVIERLLWSGRRRKETKEP